MFNHLKRVISILISTYRYADYIVESLGPYKRGLFNVFFFGFGITVALAYFSFPCLTYGSGGVSDNDVFYQDFLYIKHNPSFRSGEPSIVLREFYTLNTVVMNDALEITHEGIDLTAPLNIGYIQGCNGRPIPVYIEQEYSRFLSLHKGLGRANEMIESTKHSFYLRLSICVGGMFFILISSIPVGSKRRT